MVIWGLCVIIDGSLYGRVLGYPLMDYIFIWHMERTYIVAVLRCVIFEKTKNLFFCDILKNSDYGKLAH